MHLRIGMNPSNIMIGSLPLNDFIAAVFGLFAYGRQLEGTGACNLRCAPDFRECRIPARNSEKTGSGTRPDSGGVQNA